MSQALVVSNDLILNDIYAVNLNAYVATNITIKENADEAIKLLELNPNFDVVICFFHINGEDTALKVIQYCQSKKYEVPIIVVGSGQGLPANIPQIPAKYNIQNLLKVVAKILEISAKDMAELQVPDFFPIPLNLFAHIKICESDIFIRNKEFENVNYVKIGEKAKPFAFNMNEYQKKGIKCLYVPSIDRLRFINQASGHIVNQLLDPKISKEKRVDLIIEGMEFVAFQISENEQVPEEIMNTSKACLVAMNEVARQFPDVRGLLELLLKNKSKYIFLHGIIASYIAKEIIENISWGGEGQADKIAFCLFFHDLFLVPLYDKYPEFTQEEEILYSDRLNETEKDLVLNHAKMAGELIQTFKHSPIGANTLVTQHHGDTKGVGFASSFKDNISPLAKVMIIAEDFTSELLKLEPSLWKTNFNKKEVITSLREKFTRPSYQKIVDCLEQVRI
jgi:hypothetical protein